MRADEGRVDGPPPPDAARLRTIAALDMTGLPKASDTPDRECRFTARDAATAASEAKSWFLGAASHELRTPPDSALGWTQALPPRLRTDERRLRQILCSVLDNAVTFGCRGEVRLRLAWQAAGGLLRAEMLDHGPGVSAGLRNRLFQDFAHQDPGGRGLGLSVSARLAAQLGGEVGHADRPDGQPGSLFWLQVPAPRAA